MLSSSSHLSAWFTPLIPPENPELSSSSLRPTSRRPRIRQSPIVATINYRSEVFLKNQPKSLRDLKTEIEALIAFNKMRPVLVCADKSVVFDRVVQVLDVVNNAGVECLAIAIEEKGSPVSPPSP